jgi:aminoglycoside phosphotransferase (APT) family kinase protein
MPQQPWVPEREVDATLARAVIEAQFPDLAPAHVEKLAAGWDNTAYVVNGAWVFRFPRRQIVVALLEREVRLLPVIAPRVPAPVPLPTRLGQPSAEYPWPFAGYRMLPGRVVSDAAAAGALDDAARARLAESCARFLAALHAFAADEAALLGAGQDEFGRVEVPRRTQRTRDLVGELDALGAFAAARHADARVAGAAAQLDAAAVLARLREVAVEPAAPRPRVLVHGDFYARNLLVDDVARLVGVLDWGDVHVGDPAVDLAAAFTLVPPAARASFRASYDARLERGGGAAPISDETWRLARFRAIAHTAAVARYAHDVADAPLAADTMRTLARAIRD